MRAKTLNAAGYPTPPFYRPDPVDVASLPNTFAISPYSAIFCRQVDPASQRNHNQANDLSERAQKNGHKFSA